MKCLFSPVWGSEQRKLPSSAVLHIQTDSLSSRLEQGCLDLPLVLSGLAVCSRSVGSGASPVPSTVMGCTAQSLLSRPLCWGCQRLPLKCSLSWSLCQEGRGTSPPPGRWEKGVLCSVSLAFCPPAGGTWLPTASPVKSPASFPLRKRGK